jgi:hypothetical protein
MADTDSAEQKVEPVSPKQEEEEEKNDSISVSSESGHEQEEIVE